MALKLGKDAIFAYASGGTFASPTLVPVPLARDGSVDLTFDEGDASSRVSGVKMVEPTMLDIAISVQILEDPTAATYAALHAAMIARTSKIYYAGTGALASSGNQYVKFTGKITQWKRGEPLNGVNTVDVVVKPSYDDTNAPVVAIT